MNTTTFKEFLNEGKSKIYLVQIGNKQSAETHEIEAVSKAEAIKKAEELKKPGEEINPYVTVKK